MNAVYEGGSLTSMHCIDNTSSQAEWTTFSTHAYSQNNYLIDSIGFTLYNNDLTVEKTFFVVFNGLLSNAMSVN